ncbi:unnamed protein product [Eruca vesicaria subsp. sativa]|uniref:Thionin n=1 Tax=Eruca vesicaria subsp. sativa TaxID=29727 RepID=A0ABC8JRG7_ERUVS|nr:unnamed protein product [Eruca vesicaria subsp. sativa]
MEGKTVILSLLIMSLLMAQNQVKAKVCCMSKAGVENYIQCHRVLPNCEEMTRCRTFRKTNPCKFPYPAEVPEKSGDAVNEYCKLGCASSVCGALTTLKNSEESEIVDGAVVQCTNACANLCTKGSADAVETA